VSVFGAEFVADRRNVRGRHMRSVGKYNYHRGVEWNWLAQFFVRAELKYGEPDIAFRRYLRGQVAATLHRGGIGGIGELCDLSGARGPEFQAWSMSGFLEALHAFAGVEIDVPAQRIAVTPQLPRSWPELSVRKWYAGVPFDLEFTNADANPTLRMDFPDGSPPAAEVEINLILPPGRQLAALDLQLDGRRHVPPHQVEPLPGSRNVCVRLSVPAAASLRLEATTTRATARSNRTA